MAFSGGRLRPGEACFFVLLPVAGGVCGSGFLYMEFRHICFPVFGEGAGVPVWCFFSDCCLGLCVRGCLFCCVSDSVEVGEKCHLSSHGFTWCEFGVDP